MRSQFTKPKFWLSVLVSMGVVIGVAIACRQVNAPLLIQMALLWVKSLGSRGVLAFIVIYNLATLFFIPGSLLTLGGGALYGVFWGAIYVVIAATLGAVIAFLIGRYFARTWVSQQIQNYPNFQLIDTAVAREGFKIVLLTRLSPIVPFNLLNYAFGVTGISLKDYTLGSIGMIPGTVMYVYLGSLVGDLAHLGTNHQPSHPIMPWIIRAIGLGATVAVTVCLTRVAHNAFTQTIDR